MSQSGSLNNGSTNSILEFTGGTGTSGTFPVAPNAFGQISLSSTDGTVTIVGGVNSIDLSAASGVFTVTGNSGTATPVASNIDVITANATVQFVGSGDTITQDFGLNNLVLGSSLPALTTGDFSVGLGNEALASLTSGANNTAVGYQALTANQISNNNTAIGWKSLTAYTGTLGANTGVGLNSLLKLTTGSNNTCVGVSAGANILTGSDNTFIGNSSGISLNAAESSNIMIENDGTLGDNNTIRIGTQGAGASQQNKCFIAGIAGVSNSNATLVTQNSSTNQMGVLATANSSFPATNSTGTLAMRALSVVVQIFTADGTYTPTAGMLYCMIEVVGSGGGSGGCAATGAASSALSAGGGGGEYARGVFSAATIGASKAVTVGAAGTAGTAGNNAGGTGGTVNVTTLITAIGGGGGAGSGTTTAGVGVSNLGGIGGTGGTGGDFRAAGSPGGNALASFGNFGAAGYGGASFLGGGGQGRITVGAGIAGTAYGSGGGGTSAFNQVAQSGAAGAKGIVIITEYVIA
tara:strand:- start:4840 stop:6405 length:1566 start_codon:yes stop_codon:yes gene_type:complete